MTNIKFLIIFLFAFCSCGQNSTKNSVDKSAVELNDNAMKLVSFIDNADSSKKAIQLLDKATSIDSNYFLAYYNKLMFLNQLKQFDRAIITVDKLIKLKPNAHDLWLTGGIIYEQQGDTISSKKYFTRSLSICSTTLDTMSYYNQDYEMLTINKALNLIMLGEKSKADEVVKKLYNSQTDDEFKKMTLSILDKNKEQLLELIIDKKYNH